MPKGRHVYNDKCYTIVEKSYMIHTFHAGKMH